MEYQRERVFIVFDGSNFYHIKKKVEYIGLTYSPSFGLMKKVNETKLLTKKDLERFK